MSIAFTTDGLPERDRIPFWVDVASKAFCEHNFSTRADGFGASLTNAQLDALTLARCDCGPCEVTRTPSQIARDGIDDLILCIRLSGRSVMAQAGRTVVIDAGTIAFMDTALPIWMEFPEPTTTILVTIPRRAIEPRIGGGAAERVLSVDLPIAALAAEFLRMLTSRVHMIEQQVHGRLAEQALDLISLTFTSGDGAPALSSPRASALLRLKAAIDARLTDPSLKPADAAAAAGISVRYANHLLSEENSSVERYILNRRLERCRRALEDPLQTHRMIGEIAFSWGFSDHSHFTRRFRSAYGMTPADCRRQLRAEKA